MSQQQIYSRGTMLEEIPPRFSGITVRAWEDRQWATWREEAAKAAAGKAPYVETLPLSGSRDNYGMKGVRGYVRGCQVRRSA